MPIIDYNVTTSEELNEEDNEDIEEIVENIVEEENNRENGMHYEEEGIMEEDNTMHYNNHDDQVVPDIDSHDEEIPDTHRDF